MSASYPSPTPKNSIGIPVVCDIEIAPPPFASAIQLCEYYAVYLYEFVEFFYLLCYLIARMCSPLRIWSHPVLHILTIFCISLIRLLFVSCLPALSISTRSILCAFAYAIASNAMLAGSAPYAALYHSDAQLLCMVLYLLYRRCAECVACRKHRAYSLLL